MTTNPMNFLKVSGIRIGEAARKRKIRSGDILLAIDGYAFNEDTKELKAKFESDNAPWLLTFLRGDVVFDVLFDEPLKSDFDLTDTEESEKAKACLKKHTYGLWNEYKTFEVYRDLHKKARIIEILKDPFAGLLPPIWMVQNRLFFPLASILIIYATLSQIFIFVYCSGFSVFTLIELNFLNVPTFFEISFGLFRRKK